MTTQKVRPDQGFIDRQDSRQQRRMRNRKVGALVMVAAFAAIAVVAIAQVRNGSGDPAIPASPATPSGGAGVTHSYFDIATSERSPVALNMSGARLPEVSPNLRNIVYGDCCTFDALTVAALDGSRSQIITPENLDGYGPTWIDDESILFQGRTSNTIEIGDLYVANIPTGDVTMVVDLPDMRNGAWFIRSDISPDGTTVLFHLPRGQGLDVEWDLWTAPLSGGEATLLRENAGFATYAPDGAIVFLDHPVEFTSRQIWIMDGDGSNARSLVKFPNGSDEPGAAMSWPQVSPDGTMVLFGEGTEVVQIADIDTGQNLGEFDLSNEPEPAWFGNDTLIVD